MKLLSKFSQIFSTFLLVGILLSSCNFLFDLSSDPIPLPSHTMLTWNSDANRIAVSGDLGLIVYSNNLEVLNRWEAEDGLWERGERLYNVAWQAEGDYIALGTGNEILVLDTNQGKILNSYAGSRIVAWSPTSDRLATSLNQEILLWDVSATSINLQPIYQLEGHANWLGTILWSPDGNLIASTDQDNTIKIWDTTSGKLLHTLVHPADALIGENLSIVWKSDSSNLISSNSDGNIRVWDISTGAVLNEFNSGLELGAYSIDISPDDHRLLVMNRDIAQIIELETRDSLFNLAVSNESVLTNVQWSPDGQRLAGIGNLDNPYRPTTWIWDAETGDELFTHQIQ